MEKRKTNYLAIFFALTKRHLMVFFKNKVRLMYTLLVPVIIFAVYLLFLRDLELSMVTNTLNDYNLTRQSIGEEQFSALWKHIGTLIDSWMLSGIIGLSTVTVALQTNTVIVEDKEKGVNRDFASSPIHRNVLITSYFFYNFIVSSLICLAFYVICLIYLAAVGEMALNFAYVLLSLVVMFFATVASTLMTVLICSFVKTEGTMMSIVAIFSTAVGFLIGAYMPLGMMPVWVQGVCAFIPGTYACSLLRYAFMDIPLANLTAFAGTLGLAPADMTEMMAELSGNFGFNLNFFGVTVNPQFQALALSGFIVIFAALNIGVGRKLAEVLGVGKSNKKDKKPRRGAKGGEEIPTEANLNGVNAITVADNPDGVNAAPVEGGKDTPAAEVPADKASRTGQESTGGGA